MTGYVYMVLTGICFGIWPLMMNRSGLSGTPASVIFIGTSMLFVLTVAALTRSFDFSGNVHWPIAIGASILGGIGLLSLNAGLAAISPQMVGKLIIVMILVQIAIPAVYDMYMNTGIELKTVLGIVFAVVAAALLR